MKCTAKSLLLAFGLATFPVSAPAIPVLGAGHAFAADCVASNNLSATASDYISRCRKGDIRSRFPGELLSKTLGEISKGSDAKSKTAWKLLNDNRFKK